MRRGGFTVLELLVVISITALVTAGAARAYVEGIAFDRRVRDGRAQVLAVRQFEQRIADLLRGAYMTTLPDDTASCFIGNSGEGSQNTSASAATVLTLTTFSDRLSPRFVNSNEEDWETLNETFGPQGGLEEASLSMSPIGQPEGNIGGLYLRTQRPADGDPTQGGYEEQINPDVTEISFEFFDGLSWQASWDSRTMGTRRLPSAVRVTYKLDGEDASRLFVVRLPHSDATPLNPVGEAE
jgi:prepilin-type N-terminal cleavage/methylation domain-containing protein